MKRLALALSLALILPAPVAAGNWSSRDVRGGSTTYSIGADVDGDGVLSWNDWIHVTATPPDGVTLAGSISVFCYTGFVSTKKPGTLIYTANGLLTGYPMVRDYDLDSVAWADNTGATCEVYGLWVDGTKQFFYGRQWFTVAP